LQEGRGLIETEERGFIESEERGLIETEETCCLIALIDIHLQEGDVGVVASELVEEALCTEL
jgi:hypothetical protein